MGRATRVAAKTHDGNVLKKAEFSVSKGTVEVPDDVPEGKALEFLEKAGQSSDDWEVTGYRRIEYGDPRDPMISTRFTFKRKAAAANSVPVEDLLAAVESACEREPRFAASRGAVDAAAVLIGDNQLGKGADDPLAAVDYAIEAIDRAAAAVAAEGGCRELLVGWLGDHIEGFVSQGGANAWRTRLTLAEQVRLTRRIMMYALEVFAPLANRVVFAAVPGNHGQSQRLNGSGVTKYDDNHDVECLNAVADAVALAGSDRFDHVEFVIPEDDHISLSVTVGGVVWGLVHGDKWRAGKHFDWWRGQAFGGMPVAGADVLACGHWHHLLIQDSGDKLFIQVPALETESNWYAHLRGELGNPGVVVAFVNDRVVDRILPVRVSGARG